MAIQTWTLTHDGEGNILPHDKLHFINFKWGDFNIADFDLVAVFSNDRLEKDTSAPFSDNITKIAGMDGQIYWSSNYDSLHLNFTLATDGITSEKLEEFKNYFVPGVERDLILSEHPYRAIAARISSPPSLSVVPFQVVKRTMVKGTFYTISTNLYKGEISLSFVADFPFWRSILLEHDSFAEMSNAEKQAVIEDKLPAEDFFRLSSDEEYCFLRDNYFYTGRKGIQKNTSGVFLYPGTSSYLYNCGAQPAYPKISFSTAIEKDSETGLIKHPATSYFESGSILTVGSQFFSYKLPNGLEEYNHAIDILSKYTSNNSVIDLKKEMRDSLKDSFVRNFVIEKINAVFGSGVLTVNNKKRNELLAAIKTYVDDGSEIEYIFDSLNKEATCSFQGNGVIRIESAEDSIYNNYLVIKDRTTYSNFFDITENELLEVTTTHTLGYFKIDFDYLYK